MLVPETYALGLLPGKGWHLPCAERCCRNRYPPQEIYTLPVLATRLVNMVKGNISLSKSNLRCLLKMDVLIVELVDVPRWGWSQGQWPQKDANFLLHTLKNSESNAKFRV